MYEGLLHAHSGWRWIILLLLLLTVIISAIGWFSKKDTLSKGVKMLFKFNMIAAHIQLLFGIYLTFFGAKITLGDKTVSTFFILHTCIMIIAVVLITLGNSRLKKAETNVAKYKGVFIYNFIALLAILSMIPWPSMNLGTGWF